MKYFELIENQAIRFTFIIIYRSLIFDLLHITQLKIYKIFEITTKQI